MNIIDTVLSGIQKNVFQSITRTQRAVDRAQLALASGRDVNSALDNPQNFFTSLSLSNRAGDLFRILDGIGQSVRTVQQTVSGVEGVIKLLDQAEALVEETRNRPAIDGDILNQINGLSSGVYNFDIAGQTQSMYVDFDGIDYWLLVGRGREGWEFDDDGQGNPDDVIEDLGTQAAFRPVAYDDDFVNRIIGQTDNADLLDVDIRIRRAANVEGTEFQDVLWNSITETDWTFAFSESGVRFEGFDVEHRVDASVLGASHIDLTSNTSDSIGPPGPQIVGNDQNRVFTWDWPVHGDQAGFSYGGSVAGVDNDDSDTFLWEFTTENHAIPYSEVYIKLEEPSVEISSAARNASFFQSTSYDEQYVDILSQIDQLVEDTNFRGLNLLDSENLITSFNEDGSNTLTTEGIDATSLGLGLEARELTTSTVIDEVLDEIRTAKETLRRYAGSLQNDLSVITARQNYTNSKINTLKSAADDLTVADQNKTGAEFLALQVRQQMQFEVLSFVRSDGILRVLAG